NREPHGLSLEGLLRLAVSCCETVVSIVREPLTPRGAAGSATLQPFLRRETWESKWPSGSTVGSAKVLVQSYAFSHEFVTTAMRCNESLFAWRNPWSPEDLSLLLGSGEPWLVTNAHEHRATLFLDAAAVEALVCRAPDVAPLVGSDG